MVVIELKIELVNEHGRIVGNRIYVEQHHWNIYEHKWALILLGTIYFVGHVSLSVGNLGLKILVHLEILEHI